MDDYAFLRPSLEGDERQLKALWKTVFGDEDALIDDFFRLLYRPGLAVVAVREGAIVSAGYCLPGPTLSALNCAYIYSMATLPEHRGRGLGARIARLLTDRAFAAGADLVVTLPASESLCGWYERTLGMEPVFKKGGPGVTFPERWHSFARLCGPHDPTTPTRLWAVAQGQLFLPLLRDTGWECSFD